MLVGQARDLLEWLEHAGRRLPVDERNDLGGPSRERRGDRVRLDDPPPLAAHGDDLGTAPLGDLDHQEPEAAALGHDDPIAGLDQRDDRGLQAGAPRARHRERALVRGLEREARELDDLAHDRRELRVELAEERRRHRAQHARIGHRGPGTEEDPHAAGLYN